MVARKEFSDHSNFKKRSPCTARININVVLIVSSNRCLESTIDTHRLSIHTAFNDLRLDSSIKRANKYRTSGASTFYKGPNTKQNVRVVNM